MVLLSQLACSFLGSTGILNGRMPKERTRLPASNGAHDCATADAGKRGRSSPRKKK